MLTPAINTFLSYTLSSQYPTCFSSHCFEGLPCLIGLVLGLWELIYQSIKRCCRCAIDLFYRFLWRRGFLCFLRRSMFFRGLQVLRRMVCFTECMVLVNDRVLKNRSTSLWGVIHWFSCRIEGVLIQYIYVDKLIVMRKQAALKLRQMI